ncbi:hypothetical protein D3C84_1232330 [compost metagenome]
MAERRIFPAIDIRRSGTRKEDLLIPKEHLDKLWAIRKAMTDMSDFTDRFLRTLKTTKSNEEFFQMISQEQKNKGVVTMK